jgi:hypothetical protein
MEYYLATREVIYATTWVNFRMITLRKRPDKNYPFLQMVSLIETARKM